jgi:rubrerythrin
MKPLEQEPTARPRSLHELMSVAAAMESEAVRRYAQLAEQMTRRGDHGLAATFQAMLEEERDHLGGVEHWSREVTGLPPGEAAQPWQLPAEIARSWDEVAGSALLTPYRALSIAVLNEERGFAFYTYLAAHAEDPAVRDAAERLATEELNHAALLRRERRRAFRREQGGAGRHAPPPTLAEDFARRAKLIELETARKLTLIAAQLAALGDHGAATTLTSIADAEREAAALLPGAAVPAPLDQDLSPESRVELLRAALAEAERIYDFYADLADHAGSESVLRAAQQGAARAVRHLGLIAARLHAPAGGATP